MARKNKYKDMRTVSLAPTGTRTVGSASKNSRKQPDYRSLGKVSKKEGSTINMVNSSSIQQMSVKPVKETKVKTPKPPKPPKPPKTPKEPKEPRDWKWLKILLAVIAGIAVLVLAVLGIRYAVQQNAAQKAEEAKTATTVTEEETTTQPAPAVEFTVNDEYISKHDYCIGVNVSQNLVVVYTKDENNQYTVPYKAFICSCGSLTGEEQTVTGSYVTESRQSWRWITGGYYTQYATCVDTDNKVWFQSVPYLSQDPSDLNYKLYNQLGTNVSDGTVYMTVEGAKFIYDNCGLGTEVIVYGGKKAVEPLKADTLQKLDDTNEKTRGWDPTDPDPSNPWNPTVATKVVNTIPTTTTTTTYVTTAAASTYASTYQSTYRATTAAAKATN